MKPIKRNLTKHLLSRGDHLSIENGQLKIVARSKIAIPNEWIKSYRIQIISEIINALKINNAMQYLEYSTGKYGRRKASGLTLQFLSIPHNESLHTIFNVQLEYLRNGKNHYKGDRLPNGHFRVGKRSYFYNFWLKTKLKMPRYFSSIHDYMGALGSLIFVYTEKVAKKNKIKNCDISTLSISYRDIFNAFEKTIIPEIPQQNYGDSSVINRIETTEKESSKKQQEYLIAKYGGTGKTK